MVGWKREVFHGLYMIGESVLQISSRLKRSGKQVGYSQCGTMAPSVLKSGVVKGTGRASLRVGGDSEETPERNPRNPWKMTVNCFSIPD